MIDNETICRWIEQGRQIGKRFSFELNGQVCWSSVGIQKYNGLYKVSIDEILESNMNAEKYSKDILATLHSLEEVAPFIAANSKTTLFELRPLKGQKIFNPEFD